MCHFMSGIVRYRGGEDFEVFTHPATDSHQHLNDHLGIDDSLPLETRRAVCVECNLRWGGDVTNPEDYELRLDEESSPPWWSADLKGRVQAEMRRRIAACVVSSDRSILLGGCWILKGKVSIGGLVGCRIINAGDATIDYAGDATIEHAGFATIEHAGFATIIHAGGARIKYASGARIGYAGGARIRRAGGARIDHAGFATISSVGDARIKYSGDAMINGVKYRNGGPVTQ